MSVNGRGVTTNFTKEAKKKPAGKLLQMGDYACKEEKRSGDSVIFDGHNSYKGFAGGPAPVNFFGEKLVSSAPEPETKRPHLVCLRTREPS